MVKRIILGVVVAGMALVGVGCAPIPSGYIPHDGTTVTCRTTDGYTFQTGPAEAAEVGCETQATDHEVAPVHEGGSAFDEFQAYCILHPTEHIGAPCEWYLP